MRLIPYFNLQGHLLEGKKVIIPIEQPPIIGSKIETDLLRLEREAFLIRTLEKKAINVESGKFVERDKK